MKFRSVARFTSTLLVCATAAACTDLEQPTSLSESVSSAAATSPQIAPRPLPPTLDQEFMEIADQAPGFGGYYDDSQTGARHVFLMDMGMNAVAAEAVNRHAVRAGLGQRSLVFEQGQFDIRDLFAWRTEVMRAAGDLVTMGDLDEVRNRLISMRQVSNLRL